MRKLFFLFLIFFSVFTSQAQNSESVKQPTLMVFPSDNLLKLLKCIDSTDNQGVNTIKRDYAKAFRENSDLNMAILAISNKFAAINFPIQSLEQTLKILQDDATDNTVDDIQVDPRTMLLRRAKPDIILELGYEYKKGGIASLLVFNFAAIDAYTGKVVSAIGHPGLPTNNSNVALMLSEQVEKNIQSFQNLMSMHFEKTRQSGREVRVRIQVAKSSEVDMENDECGSEFVNDYIQQWVKANSKNGAFKRQFATSKEIYFTEVRIPLYDASGQGLGIDEWIKPLRRDLTKNCKFKTADRTTGLGDGRIVITK